VVEGFRSVEVEPFPKFHCQLVGLPVERSWKLITIGAQPDVWPAVKLAVGACAKQETLQMENKRKKKIFFKPVPVFRGY
jgi:hypothetical protein